MLHHLQEKDLQRPTPCTEFNVSQLVDHLAGNLALACKAMGSEQADDPSLAPEPRIAQLAQAALESFSARGLEGTLDLGFAEVPASVLSGILNLESMVHGWDFAQATSQEFDVDPGLAEYVLELARATVGEQQRASGSLGPETAIAESAGSLERLIAFTGRVPAGARAAPMVDAATSIVIRRPLHEVAGSTMDPLNAPAWYRNISTARRLDEGNFGIGARAAFEARFRGRPCPTPTCSRNMCPAGCWSWPPRKDRSRCAPATALRRWMAPAPGCTCAMTGGPRDSASCWHR